MMPMAHQSTGLPYPWRRMTSGAMYSGVPHTWGQAVSLRPGRRRGLEGEPSPAPQALGPAVLPGHSTHGDPHARTHTCLSRNSRASFSMWPSYRLVVRLISPILERPKSVSLMCPMEVMSRLQ